MAATPAPAAAPQPPAAPGTGAGGAAPAGSTRGSARRASRNPRAAQPTAPPPRIDGAGPGVAASSKLATVAVQGVAPVRSEPEIEDPLYDLGYRLQQKGEVRKAIEAYSMAAAANPGHAATWYNWGYLLQSRATRTALGRSI